MRQDIVTGNTMIGITVTVKTVIGYIDKGLMGLYIDRSNRKFL